MKKYKIKTPNKYFAGTRHGVRFRHGEAEAELTEQQRIDFQFWGYEVQEVRKGAKETAPKEKKIEK